MPEPERWTSSMAQAWEYIVSAAKQGLGVTESLDEYRGGGGAIRTQDWSTLFHRTEGLTEASQTTLRMPADMYLPQRLYTETQYDWAQEYIAQVRITGKDENTGEWTSRWMTLEFDQTPTRGDLDSGIKDWLGNDSKGMAMLNFVLQEVDLYHRELPE